MIPELKRLYRELESKDSSKLENPTNRVIVQARHEGQVKRLDQQVYIPLEKEHPSLKFIFEESRKCKNPIDSFEDTRMEMKKISGMREDLGDFFDSDHEHVGPIKKMFELIKPATAHYETFAPIQLGLYVAITDAARQLGKKLEVDPVRLFDSLEHADEVERIVIPTRHEAELFSNSSILRMRQGYDMSMGIYTLGKLVGHLSEETINKANNFPTSKVIDTFFDSYEKHLAQEFDRIYS